LQNAGQVHDFPHVPVAACQQVGKVPVSVLYSQVIKIRSNSMYFNHKLPALIEGMLALGQDVFSKPEFSDSWL